MWQVYIYKSQAQYRTGQNDLHNFDFSQFHKTSAIYLRDPANLSCILLYPIVRDKPPTWAWTCTDFSRSSRSSYILASTTILPCPPYILTMCKDPMKETKPTKTSFEAHVQHPPSAFMAGASTNPSLLTTHPRRRIENCSNDHRCRESLAGLLQLQAQARGDSSKPSERLGHGGCNRKWSSA